MNADQVGLRLNKLLAQAGLAPIDQPTCERFAEYLSLFVRWNARLNLSAVRDEEGILSRHILESIACARALPAGIATLLDYGSGAGLPGIPIALCRPEISITLAESQGKKAAFLQEAVRTLGLETTVHAGRAELLAASFNCVTLRAVDRMAHAVSAARRLVASSGWLGLMTSRADLAALQAAAGARFTWREAVPLPGSDDRLLVFGRKSISLPASPHGESADGAARRESAKSY
jgi:16S rRNA (guanine527-N7)-methyltransferase